MIVAYDYFDRLEKPAITLCNPDYSELYSLEACANTQLTLKWNAQSELSLTYPQTVNDVVMEAYGYLVGKRLILVDNIGYFVITDVSEGFDGSIPIKNVSCLSLESELVFKKLIRLTGTYKFYNSTTPADPTTIVGYIFGLLPNWTVSSVDADLIDIYRTFDVSDTNIYNFLTTEVAVAYGCFFIFDYLNRTVAIVSSISSPTVTDIYLSFDNLIKRTDYTEITSEISTCLYVYGGNDLDIRDVNPLGTNTIYDFTYYKSGSWMSVGLVDALTAWQTKYNLYQPTYIATLAEMAQYQSDLLAQSSISASMVGELAVLQEVRAARIEQELDTTEIDALIAEQNVKIANQDMIITSTCALITTTNTELVTINDVLAFTNTDNFTSTQYGELQNYIFENMYKNDNITTTDSMTYGEIQAQSLQLYSDGSAVLAKAAIPRYSISVDSVNFLALKEYLVFNEQLALGSQITIDSGKGYAFDATLLELTFSYDDPTVFSVVLSNRQRIDDSHFILSDLIGELVKALRQTT